MLWQDEKVVPQITPINPVLDAQRMTFWQRRNDTLTPERQRFPFPSVMIPNNERNINGRPFKAGDKVRTRSVNQLRLDIGETLLMLNKRRTEIPRGERGVNANGQMAAFTPVSPLKPRRYSLDLLDNPLSDFQEFPPFLGRSSASSGTFE
jgi:hypothetical protein